MNKAIRLKFVPYDDKKHLLNHFFGHPVVPEGLLDGLDDTVFFLGMIHLPDIADLDPDYRLPHEGNLYFFLDTKDTTRKMRPIVIHSEKEPKEIIDDFNEDLAKEIPCLQYPVGVEYELVKKDAECCKLLGVPCDWNYAEPPASKLLLQISHYDEDIEFLPELDGFTYIFFGEEGHEFDQAYGHYEYS